MAINSVGDFILFLGKAGVVTAVVFVGIELIKVLISFSLSSSAAAAAASAFFYNAIIFPFSLFYFIFIFFKQDKPGVAYIWTPILVAAIFAYLIAHCFISVFEVMIIIFKNLGHALR